MTREELKLVRKDYNKSYLTDDEITDNPFQLFEQWLGEARAFDETDFNVMTLSTIGEDGFPHSRIVLLRDLNERGFTFYTNYESDKAKDIKHHPKAAINFFWKELEKQVRIEGLVEEVSASESDEYFASRPRESQIGAWASDQSSRLDSREELEEQVKKYTAQFKNKKVPRPPFWGGYRIVPGYFEFWQGRSNRLHDRLAYRLSPGKEWVKKRLSP